MSCPKCAKNEVSYHYSGSDTTYDDPSIPQEIVVESVDPYYKHVRIGSRSLFPDLELRRCTTCKTLWIFRYWFADHPPLIVFGDIINSLEKFKPEAEGLILGMQKNIEVGNLTKENYEEFEHRLNAIADSFRQK